MFSYVAPHISIERIIEILAVLSKHPNFYEAIENLTPEEYNKLLADVFEDLQDNEANHSQFITGLDIEPKLISLQEHDEMIKKSYEELAKGTKNGIFCPSCNKELRDSYNTGYRVIPDIFYAYPQTKTQNIFCEFCGYKGTRLV